MTAITIVLLAIEIILVVIVMMLHDIKKEIRIAKRDEYLFPKKEEEK